MSDEFQTGDAPGRLGPYVPGKLLADRERSTVYAAVDTRDNSLAAVKVLSTSRPGWTRPEVDFGREVRLAEAVEHPHLLKIRDWDWTDGRGWIAYELAADGSLQDHLGAAGQVDAAQVRRLALQVGGALQAVHRAGLLHRDVKPSNILVDGDRFLLGDFGAARWHDPDATSTVVGSVPYMSPEQAHGELSPESDVYCLGATLYRAWTGTLPPPLAQREPEWPAHTEADEPLRHLIAAMLRPDPASRPTLDSLEGLLKARQRRQPSFLLAGAAGLLLALTTLGIVTLQGNGEPPPTALTTADEAMGGSLPASVQSTISEGDAAAAPTDQPSGPEYPHGGLVMTEQDPHVDWGPNPIYYLYRGMRFHVASPQVLEEQAALVASRSSEERLGWNGWPECCRPYSEVEHLIEGPELAYPDERSEGLLIRRDGDDQVWIIHQGIRQPATPELLASIGGPQGPDDAILLAPALFDALPTERDGDLPAAAPTPACLVPGGDIADLYEVHREGLGDNLECETTLAGGAYSRWQNGTIWWAPGIGARLVVFSINQAYWDEGGGAGWLGYPLTEETDEPSGQWGRIVVFQHGVITWTAGVGTESMTREEYLQQGGILAD